MCFSFMRNNGNSHRTEEGKKQEVKQTPLNLGAHVIVQDLKACEFRGQLF